jgi:hypothetical protein
VKNPRDATELFIALEITKDPVKCAFWRHLSMATLPIVLPDLGVEVEFLRRHAGLTK